MFQAELAKGSPGKELKVTGYKADEFREIARKHTFFGITEDKKGPNLLSLELLFDRSSRTASSMSVKGNILLKVVD